ncbi:MAG: 50S ribosomal protein L24 [Cyclobacteriaceae bacterium]|jgi:large subunit ribosomal protein L24
MASVKKLKIKIKSGDTVKVISGNDKGKTGQVVSILALENKAFVEDVNMVTKHVKPSAQNPEGGRHQQEAPIHISNLMLVDPATGEPAKVGKKKNDSGKNQRYNKKTGDFI